MHITAEINGIKKKIETISIQDVVSWETVKDRDTFRLTVKPGAIESDLKFGGVIDFGTAAAEAIKHDLLEVAQELAKRKKAERAARKAARPDKAAKRANARGAFQRRIWALDLLEQVRRRVPDGQQRRLWPSRRHHNHFVTCPQTFAQPFKLRRHQTRHQTPSTNTHKTPLSNNFARYLVRLLPSGYMRESYYQQWHNQTWTLL